MTKAADPKQISLAQARARASQILRIPEKSVEDDLLGFLTATEGDALLRARAGSGKTTALTIKAAHLTRDLGVDPSRIMMLTFNNAAARSLESRIAEAGVPQGIRVRTFHALGQRIVRAHFGGARRTVFDERSEDGVAIQEMMEEAVDEVINERFFHFCASRMRTRYDKRVEYVESVGREALISAVQFLRARGYGLQKRMENAWEEGGPMAGNAVKVIMAYEKKLKEARLLDGVSVLQAAAWTLEREIETGVMKMSEAHDVDWIFIDEYQDVSLPYMRLVSAIRDINGMANVQGVGDDYQSINGFAGSDLVYFTAPETALDEPVKLDLLKNRRSGSDIVEWGNQVMLENGFAGAPAVPDPQKGKGKVRETRISAERDFHYVAERLASMADIKHETIALIARKWKVGDHGLSKLARSVEKHLKDQGWKGKVTAITAHGSKGLEFDEVLLLDDGSFPMQHPSRPILQDLISEDEYLREEACLKHVAGTRAKDSLVVVSM